MTLNTEYQTFLKLKNLYPYYAAKCLKIKTKTGEIQPFVFNKAQWHIHNRLEHQKHTTGKVRAVVVKGRQQGACYTPDMRVLTSDYRWVSLADICVGESLVAVDENHAGRKHHRRLKETRVEAKFEFELEVFELLLSSGHRVVCSADHRHLCRKRGADVLQWRELKHLRVGDDVRVLTPRPAENPGFEDGWFSGLLDGEGSFAVKKSGGVELKICQVDGPVLQRAKKYLEDRDVPYRIQVDNRKASTSSKFGNKPVFALVINTIGNAINLMSLTRPARFRFRTPWVGCALPRNSMAQVVRIQSLGKKKVIDLQTTDKTYVCEGVISHNSTYISGRFFHKVTLTPGLSAFILSHISDSTRHLFEMPKRFYDNAPPVIVPKIETLNERRLVFAGINSDYGVGTAGSEHIGRGLTVQLFHGSEVAFWENTDAITTGILQAIPDVNGTEIIFESTTNGVGNMFHTLAMSGLGENPDGDFITIFTPWFWQPEYAKSTPPGFYMSAEEEQLAEEFGLSPEQIYWRRRKIVDTFNGDVWKFKQEYPCSVQEAFIVSGDILLSAQEVTEARHRRVNDINAPVVIGCDPARGHDRTIIIVRRGREIVKWFKYDKMDEMTLAGILANLIDQYEAQKCFIDIGCGYGTVDRLRETGYTQYIVPIHFGSTKTLLQPEVYFNKRAEMADLVRQWFQEGGASIPDDDEFHLDMLAVPPLARAGSRGLLALPPKEDIKKKFGRSPDIFDGLMLTFAFPVAPKNVQTRVRQAKLDVRRSSSPLSTVRDFNRINSKENRIYSVPLDLT